MARVVADFEAYRETHDVTIFNGCDLGEHRWWEGEGVTMAKSELAQSAHADIVV